MKKSILILTLIFLAILLPACAAPASNAGGPATAAPAETANGEETTSAAEPSTAVSAEIPAKPPDSGLTLAGLKKAAQKAGYEIEDIEEYQMPSEPQAVDGFNVVYEDDSSSSHIPVIEFKNAENAMTYAKEVNEAGYNLCIVNGRFLTMTGAEYGVTLNDNEKKFLETLLNSEVMTYTEENKTLISPAGDFAEACLQIDAISNALDKLVNKSVLLHDKDAAEAESIAGAYVSFTMISSGDLGFVSGLQEDQVQLDAVVRLWETFGVSDMKLIHDTPHDYVLTGKRMGLDTSFDIHCSFDPVTGSLRLADLDGGQPIELFEFVPLGGDTYAFQTMYARAVVEYKDGIITSFVYSLRTYGEEFAYDFDSDSIYGKTAGIDEAWVSTFGEDTYDQFISFDGTTLKIAANSMLGNRLTAEINVQ